MTAGPASDGRRGSAAEGLWRFSLAFYSIAGAAPALIALQDRCGCDVNVILFALWAGVAKGCALDAGAVAAADAAAAPVRGAVVGELRALRRRLRPNPDPDVQALRRRVQALEIAAERVVQTRLAAMLPAGEGGTADREGVAAANLAAVLGAAASSEEAAAIRRALASFIRRR